MSCSQNIYLFDFILKIKGNYCAGYRASSIIFARTIRNINFKWRAYQTFTLLINTYFRDPEQRKAAQLLLDFIDITNEAVGDAISDLFLVETVLCARGWDVRQWLETYHDLPCRQVKVTVQVSVGILVRNIYLINVQLRAVHLAHIFVKIWP